MIDTLSGILEINLLKESEEPKNKGPTICFMAMSGFPSPSISNNSILSLSFFLI